MPLYLLAVTMFSLLTGAQNEEQLLINKLKYRNRVNIYIIYNRFVRLDAQISFKVVDKLIICQPRMRKAKVKLCNNNIIVTFGEVRIYQRVKLQSTDARVPLLYGDITLASCA